MLQFTIIDQKKILTKKMHSNFHKVVSILSRSTKRLFDVSIINDQQIRAINHKYRKVNRTTDVIAFAFNDSKDSIRSELIGEIFINYQQAQRQAQSYDFTIDREMTFLFLHGLLHLLGFDHMKSNDEKKMIAMQNKIMQQLKL